MHHRLPGRGALPAGLGLAGEEGEDVCGVGQPPEGDRAELVAGGLGGQVGDQVAAGVEGVGDPVDGGVEPDRVGRHDGGDHGAQPVLVGRGDRDVAAAPSGLPLGSSLLGVGLDHLGLGDPQQPPVAFLDRRRDGPVDQRHGRGVELAGHRGHLAGGPQITAALPQGGVEPGQPVSQVQPVGDQRPGRQRVLAPGDGQLTQREVLHHRGAGPTEPHQPRPTRCPGAPLLAGVIGVQVGPVQPQLQLTHLGRTPIAHRGLGRRQRPRSVEILDGNEADRLGHGSIPAPATDI